MTFVDPIPQPAHDEAPSVSLVGGEIVVLGPGSTGFSMTRQAAMETRRRLAQALRALPAE
jgi:hypothetical protein